MPETPHHYGDDEIVNPETHHESSDVNVRALIWFAVIVVVFAIVTHLVLGLQYKLFVRIEKNRNKTPMTGIARTPDMTVPQNQPLLQPFPRKVGTAVVPPYRVTPISDLADMRAAENRALHSYGWVDRQHGIVRMPIDVAMQLTLQRGLPVQAGSAGGVGGATQTLPVQGVVPASGRPSQAAGTAAPHDGAHP